MPQYCLVKHRISTYVIDGADSDRNPDRVPVTGVVTFEALLDKGDSVVVTEDGGATTITLAPIEARITNGEIYHRGEEGVKLFAGGPDTNPEKIRYRAKFSNLIAGGKKIELKNILFEAIPGGELTLSMAQPVPGKPYPGYTATIEAGITQISDAAVSYLELIEGVSSSTLSASSRAVSAADAAGQSALLASTAAAGATTDRDAVATDRGAASDAAQRAEAAALQAQMTTVGVNLTESPPGSGLWALGGDTISLMESEADSGLYTIGVI